MGKGEKLPTETKTEVAHDSWAPWLALSLAVGGVLSYVVSLVLPYYVNDRDRLPLEDIPWRQEFVGMWPHDTAYSLPFSLAGAYAMVFAPFVAAGVALWAGGRAWLLPQSTTRRSYAVTLSAALVSVGTLAWLLTPLASTLITRWLD